MPPLLPSCGTAASLGSSWKVTVGRGIQDGCEIYLASSFPAKYPISEMGRVKTHSRLIGLEFEAYLVAIHRNIVTYSTCDNVMLSIFFTARIRISESRESRSIPAIQHMSANDYCLIRRFAWPSRIRIPKQDRGMFTTTVLVMFPDTSTCNGSSLGSLLIQYHATPSEPTTFL